MQPRLKTLFIISSLAALLNACANPSPLGLSDPEPTTAPDEELTPYSNEVTYARKWSEIILHANFAKTIITLGAHLSTSRNACGRDAYGAIPLEEWNTLAQAANSAVDSPLGPETCFEEAQELDQNGYIKKHVDGSVQIKLENQQTLDLFYAQEGQICTHLKDRTLAQHLLHQLDQEVIRADREDCPNGWGSN